MNKSEFISKTTMRLAALLLCLSVTVPQLHAAIVVAGNNTSLFGGSWQTTSNSSNTMSHYSGNIYYLAKTNVSLNGTTEYKVVDNGSWYPSSGGNLSFTATGTRSVVFIYDSSSHNVSLFGPFESLTVAGVTELTGANWSTTNTACDMSTANGYEYTLTLTNVTLTAGDKEFKVVQDHSWDSSSWPGSNYKLNIGTAGDYDVTFTFNVLTQSVNATATPVSAQPTTPDYYITGDNGLGLGGFSYTPSITMTHDEESDVYTYSHNVAEAGTYYFAFADGQGGSWDDFNNNHRYGPTTGNETVTLNSWATTQKGSGAYAVTVDAGTVSITLDVNNMRYRVEGTAPVTSTDYYVKGDSTAIFPDAWSTGSNTAHMTDNGDGTYSWTSGQFHLTAGTAYKYKVYGSDGTWHPLNSGNQTFGENVPGTYTVTVTYDSNNETVTAQLNLVLADPQNAFDIYVRYKGSEDPGNVFIYAWDNNGTLSDPWSDGNGGTALSSLSTQVINGYTYYTVTYNTYDPTVNIIFNENASSSTQTADLTAQPGDNYFTYGSGSTIYGPNPQADPAITSYYAQSSFAGWTTTGTLMTSNGDGTYSKTFTGITLMRDSTYEYKVMGDDNTAEGVWFGPAAGNATFSPEMNGTYSVTITLLADGTITHSLSLTQAGAIYLTGDNALGGFSCDNGLAMTYTSDGIYTYSTTLNDAATIAFVFADGQDADWSTFNSNYRIGPTSGPTNYAINTALGEYTATQRAGGDNGAYMVKAGAGALTFYYDAVNMRFQVVGSLPPVIYYVVGNDADVFGAEWTQNAGAQMSAASAGQYTWTASNVRLEHNGDYQFKVNGDDNSWYPASNVHLDVPHDGTYNLTVTFDGTNVDYTLSLVEPDVVYLVGYANSQQWLANAGIPMTWNSSEQLFELSNVTLTALSNFAFTTQLGTNSGDWTALNSHRLCSTGSSNWAVNDYWLDKDAARWMPYQDYVDDDHNWYIEASGVYNIYLNPIDRTVRVESAFERRMYISYGVDWNYNDNSVEMSTVDENVYQTTITLNNGDYFLFSTALSDESAWGAASPAYEITDLKIGFAQQLIEDSINNYYFNGTSGKYIVVVNVEKGTVTLRRTTDATVTKIYLQKTSNVTLDPAGGTYNGQTLEGKRGGIYAWNKLNLQTQQGRTYEWAPNKGPTNYTYDGEVGNSYGGDGYLKDLPDTTTIDGKQWYAWSVANSICEFYFIRSNKDDKKSQMIMRRAGEVWLTWLDEDATINRQDNAAHLDSLMDVTRDYYAVTASGVSDNATMLEGHYYVYYTNTTGWDSVYCYAWYEDADTVIQYMGDYPGSKCTFVGYDIDGYEVWCYDFGFMDDVIEKYGQEPTGVIFDNGKGGANEGQEGDKVREQTGDLVFDNGACYDYLGMIYLGNSLNAIINGGIVNGPKYTVEDDLIGVYYDEDAVTLITAVNQQGQEEEFYVKGALYAKDMENSSFKSKQPAGTTDYVYEICAHPKSQDYPGGSQIQIKREAYDQSNWVKIVVSPNFDNVNIASTDVTYDHAKFDALHYADIADADYLAQYVGKLIPGGSMSGNLVDNVNPQMHITNIAQPIATSAYEPNVYTTGHFNDTVVFSYIHQEWNPGFYEGVHRTLPKWTMDANGNYYVDHMEVSPEVYNMFYVAPKPQEIAYITWAVFDHPEGNAVNYHESDEPQLPGAFYAPMNWDRTGELWDGTTIPDTTGNAPYGTTYGPYSNGYYQYGAFQVNWSLFEDMDKSFPPGEHGRSQDPWYRIFKPGQAYKMLALIRYAWGEDTAHIEHTAGTYGQGTAADEYNDGRGNGVWNAPRRDQARPQNMQHVPYANLNRSKFIIFPLRGSDEDTYGDDIGNVTAVKEVGAARTIVAVRYYNLMGVESSAPMDGINIVVTSYSDGSRSSKKILR